MGEKTGNISWIMIEIHRSALVLVPAEKLYSLINDIEAYPEFLEGVSAAEILEQSATEMLGRLVVKKAGFEKTLITRNQLTYPSRIEMNLEQGPLEYLNGIWQVKALHDTGCKVSLDLTFSAAKGLKMMAFSALFKQIADSMVGSFVDRAHTIYS
ncbi:MAG: type II toxin-antitoxin system RatA family toxin [Reinekea sp.]|jgi:ribosome-associated toxin RatA of RatAB toxin-antitoxin module|nr:type II toxin-antitoxin system RatA family toxin [Reinekea sp.]MDX1473619.1 type II toxin-antitoxin system RatA family toxin [Reinekea sp.]